MYVPVDEYHGIKLSVLLVVTSWIQTLDPANAKGAVGLVYDTRTGHIQSNQTGHFRTLGSIFPSGFFFAQAGRGPHVAACIVSTSRLGSPP